MNNFGAEFGLNVKPFLQQGDNAALENAISAYSTHQNPQKQGIFEIEEEREQADD